MRVGFRTRLALSFVIVIMLPVIVIIAGFQLGISSLSHDPNMQELRRLASWYEKIMQQIEINYDKILDYQQFKRGVEPLLGKYEGSVQVVDLEGYLLFDSEDREASLERKYTDIKLDSGFNMNLENERSGFYRILESVVIDGEVVGTAIISVNMNLVGKGIFHKMLNYVYIILGIGLLSLILLIALFTRSISRSILVPLQELNEATESIAQGNLDIRISYNKQNELGRFCNAFDIMRTKLRESLEKQVAHERERKEMIAGISHDLRTPIASIRGYVEGLQDGIVHDQKKFHRYLSIIRDKSEKLDRLIDDLFYFSQLELGELSMEFEECNSTQLLEEIFSEMELEFNGTNQEFKVQRPFPSVKIKADRRRLEQVLENIIQNAKTYIGQNGRITAWAEIKDDMLKIAIKDNGIGIAQEDLPFIFNRFYRCEKSRSRNYGGTGLGLAICKQIVENHGGTIWAESTPGKGTVIIFTIPIIQQEWA